MEKLHKRSDGIWETSSGLFAIIPHTIHGYKIDPETGIKILWFRFRGGFFSKTITVEWFDESPFILIDGETATVMKDRGYASDIVDSLAEVYNSSVDEYEAKEKSNSANGAPNTKVESPPEVAPPAKADNPPENVGTPNTSGGEVKKEENLSENEDKTSKSKK